MAEPIRNFEQVISAAREWAGREHAKTNKLWAGLPYVEHLDAVEEVLIRFGYSNPKNLFHQHLRIASKTHDLKEDTTVTIERIRWYQGPEVAAMTEAVSNEEGKNRAEKLTKTAPKILKVPGAKPLKLADRIANVEKSIETGGPKLAMYAGEHPLFVSLLRTPDDDPQVVAMWEHLDTILAPYLGTGALAPEPELPPIAPSAAGPNEKAVKAPVLAPLPVESLLAQAPVEQGAWIF